MLAHHTKLLSIRRLIANLFTGTPRSRRKYLSKSRYGNLPAIESLEERMLLVAPVTVVLDAGLLKIIGTPEADVVDVCFNDDKTEIMVTVDGAVSTSYSTISVFSIEFRGKGGDDFFTNKTTKNLKAYGGAGDDTLLAGLGNDILFGNSGKDFINGGEGNDDLKGGGGDDLLKGGPGHDMLSGSRGDDALKGDNGNDLLNGGNGDDILLGGPGNDNLQGKLGNDVLIGGNGDDILLGGPGNDNLQGKLGNDVLIGGAGNDSGDTGNGQMNVVFPNKFPPLEALNNPLQERSARLDNGYLLVYGSNNRDVINVRTKGSDIQVRFAGPGGKTFQFFSPFVKKIFVAGEGGNDSINIKNGITKDVYSLGGAGNDLIRSWSSGHNFVLGGKGKDTLYGGTGNSHIFGGPTKDKDVFRMIRNGDHTYKRSINRNDLRRILGEQRFYAIELAAYVLVNVEAADANESPITQHDAVTEVLTQLNGKRDATLLNVVPTLDDLPLIRLGERIEF